MALNNKSFLTTAAFLAGDRTNKQMTDREIRTHMHHWVRLLTHRTTQYQSVERIEINDGTT